MTASFHRRVLCAATQITLSITVFACTQGTEPGQGAYLETELPPPDAQCEHAEDDYLIEDPSTCMAALFACDEGSQAFFDDCGCGCEAAAPSCEVAPGAAYVIQDAEQCAAALFGCDPGFQPFFNDCGCGCEPEGD